MTQSSTNEHNQYTKGHCQFTRRVRQHAKGHSCFDKVSISIRNNAISLLEDTTCRLKDTNSTLKNTITFLQDTDFAPKDTTGLGILKDTIEGTVSALKDSITLLKDTIGILNAILEKKNTFNHFSKRHSKNFEGYG